MTSGGCDESRVTLSSLERPCVGGAFFTRGSNLHSQDCRPPGAPDVPDECEPDRGEGVGRRQKAEGKRQKVAWFWVRFAPVGLHDQEQTGQKGENQNCGNGKFWEILGNRVGNRLSSDSGGGRIRFSKNTSLSVGAVVRGGGAARAPGWAYGGTLLGFTGEVFLISLTNPVARGANTCAPLKRCGLG